MLRISKEELIALDPCYSASRLRLFERHKYMTAPLALKAGVSVLDILWVVDRMGHKDLCIKFALACAVRVEKLDKTGIAKLHNDILAAYINVPSANNHHILDTASDTATATWAGAASRWAVWAALGRWGSAPSSATRAAAAATWAVRAAARKKEKIAQLEILVRVLK